MDMAAIVGLLLSILSLGRMTQWSVRAHVSGYVYVDGEDDWTVPTLYVEVCNKGKYGITLHPLEYRIIPQKPVVERYEVRSWKEHNEREDRQNPRLESGELAICETPLPPVVNPRDKAKRVEVIIKTHCGKRARKVVRYHPLMYKDLHIILEQGHTVEEYLKNKFPNFPV